MYACLIVDDERSICLGLQKLLEWSKLGFSCPDIALTAHEALRLNSEHGYNLIITDIRMPGMDGLELIGRIAKQNPHARFIVISGYGDFEYARQAISLGVTGYLLKSVDENKLEEEVRKVAEGLTDERSRKKKNDDTTRRLLLRVASDCWKKPDMNTLRQLFELCGIGNDVFPMMPALCWNPSGSPCAPEQNIALKIPGCCAALPVSAGDFAGALFFLRTGQNGEGAEEQKNRAEALYESIAKQQKGVRLIAGEPADNMEEVLARFAALSQKLMFVQGAPEQYDELVYAGGEWMSNVEFARILEHIGLHFQEQITIKSIAKDFHLSPVYLGRIFKKYTGQKFSEYLNTLRIRRAVLLLSDKANKISQIGRMIGYQDTGYFYKKFKEITGNLPSDYRV